MRGGSTATPKRVVLDTNVVLSALLFTSGRLAWLRHGWQRGTIRPLVCRETTTELLRVLGYPKFGLSRGEQQVLLAEFLPCADAVRLPRRRPPLPPCRDAADEVFLVLAAAANADALVTGDKDLLALRGEFPGIVTPDELGAMLGPR
ncbi:putative toxin-antitoxin system toxin component, PIN family [Pseudohaliea sp.]|uniref:putative toxin-antitoxin system toxin component, PIN family n=1 Tax=Pseudohaliea sp. TaxID=2740289 RepID=UPI0032EAE523